MSRPRQYNLLRLAQFRVAAPSTGYVVPRELFTEHGARVLHMDNCLGTAAFHNQQLDFICDLIRVHTNQTQSSDTLFH